MAQLVLTSEQTCATVWLMDRACCTALVSQHTTKFTAHVRATIRIAFHCHGGKGSRPRLQSRHSQVHVLASACNPWSMVLPMVHSNAYSTPVGGILLRATPRQRTIL